MFHESRTLEDIEKAARSPNSDFGAQNIARDSAPVQFTIDNDDVHEEMSKTEQEDEEGDIDQGESQSSSLEVVGPSRQSDDDAPPKINDPKVRRFERGLIPSTRYPESECLLLTD